MVVFVPAHDMQALPAFQPRFPNGIHGYTNLYTVNPIEQAAKNDTADKSVTGEVKNESGPTVGNKAQSVKPSNSPTASTPEDIHDNNTVGIDDIAVISKALGHKSLASTLHYIGATQAKVDNFADKYSLGELV
ncbi:MULTISPECIES: hypothetical protein [Serratia]|uniref:hypothetical protein n=1 Tax=Serratia TaxID=613 RepID=UPI0025700BC8|nr:hypothetical protein [Serratia marcescens]WHS69869.1 hypothetical protein JS036_19605 [Serratia marcescens]WJD87229.1 hypothetical protein QRD25_19625 [Serratia marcescens]